MKLKQGKRENIFPNLFPNGGKNTGKMAVWLYANPLSRIPVGFPRSRMEL